MITNWEAELKEIKAFKSKENLHSQLVISVSKQNASQKEAFGLVLFLTWLKVG